ncbi:MAG: glycerol-3-phosphate 1-O-acyltransferase PlsY [Peptostreptococcaceae bacterium]|nr:glycerol-3-phosphate 1-O-acyltransferase PlsY [Peptostreptococcaceae bacterium]MDY5738895.1 glycerol-3-phosphate 1-O-acyltransferase PlsY [Anaerovoracaceae bacterium]
MEYIISTGAIIIAYCLGSISPSTLLARARGMDIKSAGSGNAGTTNALRVLGKKAALITLSIDILKGVLAVKLGLLLGGEGISYFCLVAAILGHIYPAFYSFKGGKGVAVAFGAILAVNWQIALICLGIVALTVLLTRWVSLGSILAAAAFPILAHFLEPNFTIICIFPALLVIYKHKANIIRLIHGEESKIFSKKQP